MPFVEDSQGNVAYQSDYAPGAQAPAPALAPAPEVDPRVLAYYAGVQDPATGRRYYGDPWEQGDPAVLRRAQSYRRYLQHEPYMTANQMQQVLDAEQAQAQAPARSQRRPAVRRVAQAQAPARSQRRPAVRRVAQAQQPQAQNPYALTRNPTGQMQYGMDDWLPSPVNYTPTPAPAQSPYGLLQDASLPAWLQPQAQQPQAQQPQAQQPQAQQPQVDARDRYDVERTRLHTQRDAIIAEQNRILAIPRRDWTLEQQLDYEYFEQELARIQQQQELLDNYLRKQHQ